MRRTLTSLRRLGRRARDDERGMTLIELMLGISLGTMVVFASYAAIDAASKLQLRTEMRVEAIGRGRNGMEDITRAIRAQQCANGQRPMIWAADTAMEFYSSIAPLAATTFQPVEKHRIFWKQKTATDGPTYIFNGTTPATQKPVGDIWEWIWRQSPSGAWPTQPVQRKIAEDVELAPDKNDKTKLAPFFRYYKYKAATGSGRVDYANPVPMTATQNGLPSASPGDLTAIVLIDVAYRVTPRRGKTAKSNPLDFYNSVSVRIADPTNPNGSPQCL